MVRLILCCCWRQHHYLTVHKSDANHSGRDRRGLVINATGEHAVVDTELREAHAVMVAEQRGVEDWKLSGDR